MRHVRQQQRNQRSHVKVIHALRPAHPVSLVSTTRREKSQQPFRLPTLSPVGHAIGETEERRCEDMPESHQSRPQASRLVAQKVTPENSTWQCGTQIPPLPNGAVFYRQVLAELFGVSLTGTSPSSVQRPRSIGITHYRGYVATTKSDLVQATDDTICLLLPACSMDDHRLLLESRRRYVVAVQCMQIALEQHMHHHHGRTLHALATIAGALEILFVEIYRPVSLGSGSLYDGLVRLVRTHWTQLVAFQGNVFVSRFLLAQLQQIMLMESLARRTALPIDLEAWRELPSAAGLIPEISEALMVLAIQVPALLESARQASPAGDHGPPPVKNPITSIVAMEKRLLQWQKEWCGESVGSIAFSYTASAPEVLSSRPRWELLPIAQPLGNLPFLSAQCMALCYICLLRLQEAASKLSTIHGDDASKHRYTARATRSADRLCELGEYFIQGEDGLLSKASSVCAALHFARTCYEKISDMERLATVRAQEERLQAEVPFLSWRALIPLSFPSMYMHG